MTASVCAHTGLALGRITQTMVLLTAAHGTSACSALHDDVEGLSCSPGVCACSALHVVKVQLIGGAGLPGLTKLMTVRYSMASASAAGNAAWLRYTCQASRNCATDFLSASSDSLGPSSDAGASSCCLHGAQLCLHHCSSWC